MASAVFRGEMDMMDAEKGVWSGTLQVAIGATGAPTINFGGEFFTITRTSAGVYSITFPQAVKGRLAVAAWVDLVAALTGGVWGAMTTDNSTSTSTPGVSISFFAAGGTTATEVASGNTITIDFKLKLWG